MSHAAGEGLRHVADEGGAHRAQQVEPPRPRAIPVDGRAQHGEQLRQALCLVQDQGLVEAAEGELHVVDEDL